MTTSLPSPIPDNEIERLLSLSALDLNYSDLNTSLSDLARLAAGIAGTSISLVNLVDAYTQWSIASHGYPVGQMAREDSVCQYTILEDQFFEVTDLSTDDRFREKEYVAGDPNLVYYFGVPLKTDDGQQIGALCVLDKSTKRLDPEKIELLKIIARQIVVRLTSKKIEEDLNRRMTEMRDMKNKLAHDIRGPIAGIIGLGKLFKSRVYETSKDKLQEVFSMIENGGESILTLAEDILNQKKMAASTLMHDHQYNLSLFKDAVEKLYLPMAKSKNILFDIKTATENKNIFFPKKMLMQITGNLISNAIKFTPEGGNVHIELSLEINNYENTLKVVVADSGIGISNDAVQRILSGTAASTNGTDGENGYGLGLCLVKRLVNELDGTLEIFSELNIGTRFIIWLPQKNERAQVISAEHELGVAV